MLDYPVANPLAEATLLFQTSVADAFSAARLGDFALALCNDPRFEALAASWAPSDYHQALTAASEYLRAAVLHVQLGEQMTGEVDTRLWFALESLAFAFSAMRLARHVDCHVQAGAREDCRHFSDKACGRGSHAGYVPQLAEIVERIRQIVE